MGQPALKEDELNFTDMAVGEILRRTRTHYGQSLQDIERALRIRASQIEAIENGDLEKLPGRVYAIGFVRSYAEYLGLDGDKIVDLFKAQSGGKSVTPELHFPVTASDSKTPPFWLVGVSLAVAFLLVIGWWMMQGGDRSVVDEVPEVPATMKTGTLQQPPPESELAAAEIPPPPETPPSSGTVVSPQDVEPSSATTAPSAAPVAETTTTTASAPAKAPEPSAATKQDIILNIKENSWVEIRDDSGKTLVSRVLKAGDKYFVPDRPDLKISLGNAAGVELEVEGQKLKPLGAKGVVKKNIPLDAASLKKTYGN